MNDASMERNVRTLIAAKAARDPAHIGLDDDLDDVVGLDSLDRLDLLAEIEDEFGVILTPEQVAMATSLRQVLAALRSAALRSAA